MLVLDVKGLAKSFGGRLIFDIESFRLYEGEKVGIVGNNGAGKTTFFEVLSGGAAADGGVFRVSGSSAYIRQFGAGSVEYLSGGEKTLEEIDRAFANDVHLIMADEPTCNLSLSNIAKLQKRLAAFKGGLMLITHDRALLNGLCTRIIEFDGGRVREYSGNYDFYKEQKALEEARRWELYEGYAHEKSRLAARAEAVKGKAKAVKKAPGRMGNSEARLHKGKTKEKSGRLSHAGAVMENRLNRLERVEKPIEAELTRISVREGTRLYSRTALEVSGAEKSFGGRVLFSGAGFKIENGSKTALIGENGSGKTTLVKMIMNGGPCVAKAPGLRAAYFSQDLSILDESADIYANVAEGSAMSGNEIRGVLARMLFRRGDVFKPVGVLSGGERVKVALCKIFCKDVNMLILDEPDNYLDLPSMDALEGLIRGYGGTVLLISHDRGLIGLADRLLIIKDGKVEAWGGSYAEYLAKSHGGAVRPLEAWPDSELVFIK